MAVRRFAGVVTHFSTNEPIAALTFDDGPHPIFTTRVLDILERFGVRVTFFMVGNVAEKHPELVKRVASAGHAIGNHSWDHRSFFTTISGKERRNQIRACERAISPYGERIFRPPWGKQNVESNIDTWVLRYKVIGWNLEVGDWWDNDSKRMADLLTNHIRPGNIILLHDSINCGKIENQGPSPFVDREPMLLALESFLESLDKKLRFATIPEMFRVGRPIRR